MEALKPDLKTKNAIFKYRYSKIQFFQINSYRENYDGQFFIAGKCVLYSVHISGRRNSRVTLGSTPTFAI
jgi:hypothetical protein